MWGIVSYWNQSPGALETYCLHFWQGPIYFHFLEPVYQESFPASYRRIDLKTQIKCYRWVKKVFVDLQKSLFFEKWHFSADVWDEALEILTENPLAATSAEENQVLSRSDDPENTKTLQTSDESCRYFMQLCRILWSYKHWRLFKHKIAFRYYAIKKQACWKLATF